MTQAELRGIIAEIMATGATCLNCANEECYQQGRFCKESPGIPCENHVPEACATCEYFDSTIPGNYPGYHACLVGECAVVCDPHNDACELYVPSEGGSK